MAARTILGALLLLAAACSDGGDAPFQPFDNFTERTADGFLMEIATTRATAAVGEPVVIRFFARNTQGVPRQIGFDTSQVFEFEIYRAGALFWSSDFNMVFSPAMSTEAIGPGQSFELTIVWDQRANEGLMPEMADAGTYEIRARVTATNGNLFGAPLNLTIG